MLEELGMQPTVNTFAASSNAVCGKFFTKWPQVGSAGVDFFCQQLDDREDYFCCPPVANIGHMLNKLQAPEKVTAVLVMPAWRSNGNWSLVRKGDSYIPEILRAVEWTAKCQDTGMGKTLLTTGKGINIWAGIFKKGKFIIWSVFGPGLVQAC